MIDNIIFTSNVVAPVFLLVALGYFVKKINVINENFVDVTSKFVYSVSLPALVFINITEIDLSEAIDFNQIIYIYAATLITFFLIWLFSIPFIKEGKNLSVFVQGAYRSNFAIVGFAIVSKLLGSGQGRTVIDQASGAVVIRLHRLRPGNARDVAHLVHECVHAATMLFDRIGFPISVAADEPLAYYVTFLVREVLSRVRR